MLNQNTRCRNALPILVVDDDVSFLADMTNFLTRSDWKYEVATDGRAALKRLGGMPYGLVLLDLGLPDIDGFSVLRNILSLPTVPPVVLISASATISSAFQAGRTGAVGFLEKPVDFQDLEDVILSSLDVHRSDLALPATIALTQVAEFVLRVAEGVDDVRTVSDWAAQLCLTDHTLAARCRRIGLTAKRVLDLARLLRVAAIKPTAGDIGLMFASVDDRTISAIIRRAGLGIRDLETSSPEQLLDLQALVDHPPLMECLRRALRDADRPAARPERHRPVG